MLSRRRLLASAAGLLAAPTVLPRRAGAESWPKKDVHIIVGFEPGGATDIIARTLADRLKDAWKHPVTVDNKPGEGGNIAAQLVAKAEADGTTILIAGPGMAINRFLYPSLGYDPDHDFAPVTLLVQQPNVMAVSPASPVKSVKDFIAYCKANPGRATYASAGNGTTLHLSGELFKRLAGVEMRHVPFKGSEPALREVLMERVDVIFDNVTSVLPHVIAGGARGLAVTTAKRISAAPNLPTLIEAGVPGFDVSSWFALYAPAKTPPGVVTKIHDDAVAALGNDQVKGKLMSLGCEIIGSTPAELTAHLKAAVERWGPLIKEAGIKLDK